MRVAGGTVLVRRDGSVLRGAAARRVMAADPVSSRCGRGGLAALSPRPSVVAVYLRDRGRS